MKKVFLALSVIFSGVQLHAQLPVNWQTATPGSFTISGSTIRNNGWTPFTDYAYSQQKLSADQDGYVEFSAENPGATPSVYYQIGFAKASAPGTPLVSFYIERYDANNIYPKRYYNSILAGYSGACLLVQNLSVLRMERVGNVIRFFNKTGSNCELVYSPPVSLTPTEDWVVVFKHGGDPTASGAVNAMVSFTNSEELWGRVSPNGIRPISLTDKVGIGKVPAVELDVNGTATVSTLSGTGTALTEATANGTLQRKTMGLATQALLGNGTWADISGFSPWKNAASPAGAIYFQPVSGSYVGINQSAPLANLDIGNSNCDNKPALRITSDETISCMMGFSNGDYIDLGANTLSGFAQRFIVKSNGYVGINRTPSYPLDVAGASIRVGSTVIISDKRFKENIKEIDQPVELLRQLSGKTYTLRTNEFPTWNFNEGLQYGFIAQELKKVMPELVNEDNEGYLGVNYTMLIPVLTEAIKVQQQQIELMKQELASLKDNKPSQTTSAITGIPATDAYLAQNVPNPFSQTTSISYKLPAGITAASLGIYDLNGKEIRLFQLGHATTGSIVINGGDLKPGMYVYTLIIDGKYFDSKKMILTSK